MESAFNQIYKLEKNSEDYEVLADLFNESNMPAIYYIYKKFNLSVEMAFNAMLSSKNKNPMFIIAFAMLFPNPDDKNLWNVTTDLSKRFVGQDSVEMCKRLVNIFNLNPEIIASSYYEIGGYQLFLEGLGSELFNYENLITRSGMKAVVRHCNNGTSNDDKIVLSKFPLDFFENEDVLEMLINVKDVSLQRFLKTKMKQYEETYSNEYNSDEELEFEPF
jgi:hypothetical protein